MILMTALLCYFVYVSYGFITIEGLLAGMFVVFFTVIVYLGSLIIELDRKVDELDAKLEKKKK